MYTKILKPSVEQVEHFLCNAKSSLCTFRYYEKRKIEVIASHLITLLYLDSKDNYVGYGHLEEENGVIWLGICLVETSFGTGLSKQIMSDLIEFACFNNIKEIELSVDLHNCKAIALYQKFGFETTSRIFSNTQFMKLKVKQ